MADDERLVDYARRRAADARGGAMTVTSLDDHEPAISPTTVKREWAAS